MPVDDFKITDTIPRVQYIATPGQTAFTIPFRFFQGEDIEVYIDAATDPEDANDYVVTGDGLNSNGTLTFDVGLTGGELVTIVRNSQVERVVNFLNSGDWKASNVNDQFNRLTTFVQEIALKSIDLAIVLPVTSQLTGVTFPDQGAATNANKLIVWNPTGTNLTNGPTITDILAVAANIGAIDTVSDNIANVNIVAAIDDDVTVVAAISEEVENVSDNMSVVVNVHNNMSAVQNLDTNMADINTLTAAIPTIQQNADDAEAAKEDAENAASSSQAYAGQAQAALASAQAIADSMAFRDTVFLTSLDDPYTVDQDDNGTMFSVDTSGGQVDIYLPQISGIVLPFVIGFKKSTSDANPLVIHSFGTDTINDGSTAEKVYASIGGGTFLPDTDTSPDRWTTSDFGAAAGEEKRQVWLAGTGFVAGIDDELTITNTPAPGSSSGLDIVFDGVSQISTEWTYDPDTAKVQFNAPIPAYVQKVEGRWRSALAVGVSADGSVSWLKLASGLIASVADMVSGAANKLVSAANLKSYVEQNVVTPWVAYTPTFTGFTPSGVSAYSRRVGDSLEVMARFSAAPGTASEARMSLGFNGVNGGITTAGSAKLPATTTIVGHGAFSVTSATQATVLAERSVSYITFGYQSSGTVGLTKLTGAGLGAFEMALRFAVPINGW